MAKKKLTSGFTNLSQSLERMGHTGHMPCITPKGPLLI